MNRIGPMWTEWTDLDWSRLNTTEWTEYNFSAQNGLNMTKLDQRGQNKPNRTNVDWIRLLNIYHFYYSYL